MAILRAGDTVTKEFSLKGFAELERALKRAPLNTMRKGAKSGLRSAANTPKKAMNEGLAMRGFTPTRAHGGTTPKNAISIRHDNKAPVKRPAVYVGLVKDFFHLAILEVGNSENPQGYRIKAKNGKVLRFWDKETGQVVFRKEVHRGPMPPRPWFTPAWFASSEQTGQKMIDLMTKALNREFKKSKGAPK